VNNKTKYWMGLIGIIGVLTGRILTRVLSNYFGSNGSNIIAVVSGTIVFCGILALIAMKLYKAAIITGVMVVPMIIMGIGLYFDNMDIMGLGLLSFFIMTPILLKVIKKFK